MKIENNKKIMLVVIGIIVLVGVFYGGMVYGKSKIPTRGQGSQAFGAGNFTGGMGARGTRTGGGIAIGQIISKDATSITVKLANGGSKIIFLGQSTKVSKLVDGSIGDLAIGTQVSVNGTANTDGSITAQTVQLRPNLPVSPTSNITN